jgi:hypothetical protein
LDDARRNLEEAVRDRRACRLSRPGGEWLPGTLCRLEAAGLVCDVPGHGLRGGEEVRLWYEEGGRPVHFEACVLRTGVPVPERGPSGLLLGFLAEWNVVATPATQTPGAPAQQASIAARPVLEVVLPHGAPLSLLSSPFRIVEAALDRLEIEVPRTFTVVFPDNGLLRLRLGADASGVHEVRGRVRRITGGDAHLLYSIELEGVERQEAHQRAIPALKTFIGR